MHEQRQPAASRPNNKPVQVRPPAVKTAPLPLDESSLKRVVGGVDVPPGPHNNW